LFIDLIGIMLEHSTPSGEENRAPEPSGHSPPPSAFSLQNDLILMAAKLKEVGDFALIVVDPRPASTTDLTKCTHHDSTLTKSEYLAVVEKQFRAADPDNDGTLDVKELRSPAGRDADPTDDVMPLPGRSDDPHGPGSAPRALCRWRPLALQTIYAGQPRSFGAPLPASLSGPLILSVGIATGDITLTRAAG
jgi:hypothetical protein